MSHYYKYEFTSPEPIYANIKEEFKSYFDSGIVDQTMFAVWTDKCLRKMGKMTYPINQTLLNVCDKHAVLPEDFFAVREAWACTSFSETYQLPNATYNQVKAVSTRLDSPDFYCDTCRECSIPDIINVIYKTTHTVAFSVRRTHLLTPGNIYAACPEDLYCANRGASSMDSYDIKDNKFVTNFKEGNVYVQYYSVEYDESSNQLVPDEPYTLQYIENFIKEKVAEQVWNQSSDETFNQSFQKFQYYKKEADEAYILQQIEAKKPDIYKQQRDIQLQRHRLNRFKLF